jgi:hypothetical protein
MVRCVLAATLLAVAMAGACTSPSGSPPQESKERKPTGSPTDPVDRCERVADVCRLDESRLGVCIAPPAGSRPPACAGRTPCFLCVSQH